MVNCISLKLLISHLNIMRLNILFITTVSVLFISGCTSSGAFLSNNQTNVELTEANYTIAATNVVGEAESAYIIGFSYASFGMIANTIAIARIQGNGMLYSEALENLWVNFEAEAGTVEGRNLALTNVRYDADILNLFLYTKIKVSVRADVVEFTN